jgi:hypothetical protein
MSARSRRRLFRHPPAHIIEPTRAAAVLAALAVMAGLAGCTGSATPPSTASASATATPTPTSGPGGYDSLSQACTAIADDLITLQTIEGTAEIGLSEGGAAAILDELAEMRELAPADLRPTYRSVEDAVRELPRTDAAAPTPTSAAASPRSPSPTSSPTPHPSATPPLILEVIESASERLTVWLTRHCADL